jgi:hypothetical protein
VTPDSAHYLAAADNLVAGKGFVRLGGEVMASWPPLYPAILATFEVVGLDPLLGAAWLNAGLLAVCAMVAVHWIARYSPTLGMTASVGIAIALAPPLVLIASLALTDLLFVTTTILALEALDSWLGQPRRAPFLRCCVAVVLACLTRYPGAVLLVTVCGLMLLLGRTTLWRRCVAVMVMGLAAGLPLALWLARNVRHTGTPFGPRYATEYALGAAVVDVGYGVMSWFVPWRVVLVHPAVGIIALSGLVTWAAVVARRREGCHGLVVCLTFVVAYLGCLVMSATTMQLDVLADRMLAPVYAPLVVACALFVAPTVAKGVITRTAGIALTMTLLTVIVSRTADITRVSWKEGPRSVAHSNYNTAAWADSPTLHWAAAHLGHHLTFASSPAALYLHARIDSRPIPRKHARRSPSVPMDDLNAVITEIAEAGGAYLVLLNGTVPSHAFNLNELRERLQLTEVIRTPDGAVFRMVLLPVLTALPVAD